jgi:PAS domain S-box-containing protein
MKKIGFLPIKTVDVQRKTVMSDRFIGVTLTFALLLLISLIIGVGYLGLNAMDSLDADARSIAETQWVNVQLANEALTYSNQNSRINMQIVVAGDPQEVDSLLVHRAGNSARITDLLHRLQTRVSSEKEKQLLNAIIEARKEYVSSYKQATDVFVPEKNPVEARKQLIQIAFPLLLKYHLAWAEFVRFQTDQMDYQLKNDRVKYAAARERTIFFIVLSVLLALGIAAVVIQKLMAEILQREKAESNVRRLNQDLELKVLERTASLDKSNRDLLAEIAHHKETEDAKSRSDQLFRSIAENSADLIAVVDQSGHRIYNNPTYQRMLGYTAEELKNTISFQQIHPDDRPLVTRAAQLSIETGVGQAVEYRMQRKDGTYVTLESHGGFIRDAQGEIQAFVISARDIGDRRMAMQTEKLSAIGQLAAGIAHELNTPAQYISDNITFLRDTWTDLDAVISPRAAAAHASPASVSGAPQTVSTDLPPDWDWLRKEVPKAIAQSLEGIRRMTKILAAMRRFSHTGGGERELVDLNEALDATLTVAQNQIRHIADVETDYQSDLPRVECYPDELNQVFLNVIVNATHAIRDASEQKSRARGQLTIRTRQIEHDVQIEIEDNGAGIPLTARPHIFDPFFTTKQVGEGTGQGLTICYDIVVQKHHGTIWFDTEVDKGTTFFIKIPIQFDAGKSRSIGA